MCMRITSFYARLEQINACFNHACLGISHLKGVQQSKGQEESQEEKKLEARKGEYNTPVGF